MDYITNADQTLNPMTSIIVLFGLFYRPPNSDSTYFASIEDSFHLALDTGIKAIIITGDFNFNLLNNQQSRKIVTF